MLTKALPTTLTMAHLLRVGTALTLSAILFALAGCSSINELMVANRLQLSMWQLTNSRFMMR